ncbi:aspartate kinase [Desulfovibrio inopinatus]|uniref:aspartate kinase n=1 Tax=Desulfovibrio inopinatus TaxID=102109 RepID=UPI00040FF86F|nr:aspartate kinase [Desulfovibrio inopinatus]
MRILVQKFGGTSVADLECMKKVLVRVKRGLDEGYKMIVVLSAMSGETNRLLGLAKTWSNHPDPAELDLIVSTGEQVSVGLFTMLLKDAGISARSLLGIQIPVTTNSIFTKARIDHIDDEKIKSLLERYDVLVMAGFQGVTCDGRITTLGRGGSDTSGVALAAAVNAELCEIYTDVEGVFTTDPNMCSTARKLDKITYDEMLEFASMGAKVLQIRSVEFAKKYNVPVLVRSTFSDAPGTLVIQEDQQMEDVLVSGIAYDKDQCRITIWGVTDKPGIAASIFSPIAEKRILVDMIVQNTSRDGHTDMTFTVPRADLEQTMEIIESIDTEIDPTSVQHDLHVAKVSVIGVGMRNHSGVASKMFDVLRKENINIKLISTSEIKITCLIDEKYTELAVRALHDAFGLDKKVQSVCEEQ